ncbi:MAG: type VII toxin-antitoxin system MntA family adenylyltransferase antitoxin [Thermoguttaceae bacterium]
MSPPQHKTALLQICEKYGIATLYAFGSRAEEMRRFVEGLGKIDKANSSDVDIAVKMTGREVSPIRQKVDIAMELEDFFGVDTVDLVLLSEADPFLAANVIRGERIYCDDTTRADEFDLFVLRRAGDLAPFERQRIEIVLNR